MSDNFILSRRFAPLFLTQAFAAFNDNFLKNILIFLILFQVSTTGADKSSAASLVTLTGAIFIAPFLFLSSLGGELADKYDKATLTRYLKLGEIFIALIAIAGFYLQSIPVLMIALFGFGVGSALFGPIKYGILPGLLKNEELAKANAWIEGATFAAILGGTLLAGLVFGKSAANPFLFAALMLAFAIICYAASLFIPQTGPAAPLIKVNANILASTCALLRELGKDRRLLLTALISSWFWLIGAIILSLLPTLVRDTLGGSELMITSYLTVFAISVALGSASAAWLVNGHIVLITAPLGTLVCGLFTLDLAWAAAYTTPSLPASSFTAVFTDSTARHIGIDLAGIAFFGALIIVPAFAALQQWAPDDRKARIIAAANVLSAAFMATGGILVALAQALGATIATLGAAIAVSSLIAAFYMLRHLPTNPLADSIKLIFRLFFRLEIKGSENIAKAGEQPIFALNHVSFLDAPLALALGDRQPVFAIHHDMAQKWWVKPFLKIIRALPLDPSRPMATRTLIRAVQEGNPLAIFPEGRITVTGSLMKIYDGAAMVADRTGSMILPIRIEGLERSRFSHLDSRQIKKSLFPKVRLTILEPEQLKINDTLKGRKRRIMAGTSLYRIMSNLVFRTNCAHESIPAATIHAARTHGMSKVILQDPASGALTYRKFLTGAAVLAQKFARDFRNESTLGIMLPSASGSVAVFFALLSAGKVPAMLNFSAGIGNILAACRAAGITTVLTSRAFIRQARLDKLVDDMAQSLHIVYLDDLRKSISLADKIRGFLQKNKPLVKKSGDDPAVILFTSGSEGTPKGVVLTHTNILSNATQAAARIAFNGNDKLFNVLPLFHSFGLTAGLILPLIFGVPVYLYPSPLHYRIIPELIYGSNASIIFGTDTFLAGYARTANPYDLQSIRLCIAGAEPVKDSTRTVYMEKFGIRILEGYGVTETAPVIALNTPMFHKSGTVGKMLPGIESRLEAVPGITEGGRLFVKGPNVMAGYLLAENPGKLIPPVDGWHDTGDIITIDTEGFICIVGRAKRFAKIGGEMVSLSAIETLADEFWPGAPSAAAAIKDAKKGERLILITEAENADRMEFLKFAKAKGASELSIPSDIIKAKVPLLGSGKIDFAAVLKLAEAISSAPESSGYQPVS